MLAAVLILLFFVFIIGVLVAGSISNQTNPPKDPPVKKQYIRCPTCGAQAEVHGSRWECGWCGDSGKVKQ